MLNLLDLAALAGRHSVPQRQAFVRVFCGVLLFPQTILCAGAADVGLQPSGPVRPPAVTILSGLLFVSCLVIFFVWRQRANLLKRGLALEARNSELEQRADKERLKQEAHERELERMNRLYAALSQVNQAVVRAASRTGLLQETCRVLVEFGGFPTACILWPSEGGGGLTQAACFGADKEQVQGLPIFEPGQGARSSPIEQAVTEGRPAICDLAGLPEEEAWKGKLLKMGYHSVAAFPIRVYAGSRGVLTVFSRQENFFGNKEQVLLVEAAEDISFGLENLGREEQRRQAEEALRQSEARFKAIFDNAGLGIAEVNAQKVFQVANDRFCEILGRERGRILGLTINELTYLEDRTSTEHLMAHLWSQRVPLVSYEKRYLRGDGSPVWVRVTATTIRSPDGSVLRGLAMIEDITERMKIEAQLRLQSAALEAAANAIVITDRNGVIEWANPAFERLTGFASAQAIGQTPRILRSGLSAPALFRQMWETILAGKVWRGELVNKRRDGSLYHEEMTITPVSDAHGEITHFIAIKLDITERKHAEEALIEARQNLEQLVAERTAQLVEANSNLQTFAHSAAHDLRAPLRTMSAFVTLASDEYGPRLDENGRMYLDRLRQSAEQMERLLNDLLEYSKLTQAEIELQTVSLSSAVHQALALLDAEIKTCRPELSVSETMPTVIAHPASVVLILTNLISNALKFISPQVRPRVQIQAEECGDFVRLSVKDNGIGIDPRLQDKLFQAFQRLHSKGTYEGTGLGLAIVRKAAERMGGRAGVESEPGQGSHFWVELRPARR